MTTKYHRLSLPHLRDDLGIMLAIGVVLIVDYNLKVLTRLWCLYECHAACYVAKSALQATTAFPDNFPIQSMLRFEEICANLDVMWTLKKAECSRPEDRWGQADEGLQAIPKYDN